MIRISIMTLLMGVTMTGLLAQTPAKSAGGIFIFLLHEDSNFKNLPDKEAQIAEYRDWADKLGKAGQLVDAAKLRDDGMIVEAKGQRKVTPAELPITGNGVAGYFVVRAQDYAAAVKLAQTCPHVKYGGRVVVRQLEQGK
jgi:hypothetical protein